MIKITGYVIVLLFLSVVLLIASVLPHAAQALISLGTEASGWFYYAIPVVFLLFLLTQVCSKFIGLSRRRLWFSLAGLLSYLIIAVLATDKAYQLAGQWTVYFNILTLFSCAPLLAVFYSLLQSNWLDVLLLILCLPLVPFRYSLLFLMSLLSAPFMLLYFLLTLFLVWRRNNTGRLP